MNRHELRSWRYDCVPVFRPVQHERSQVSDRNGDVTGGHARRRSASAREALLRSEYAAVYPFLTPEVWESAAVMADKVIAWQLRQRVAVLPQRERVLDSAHFQFRDSLKSVLESQAPSPELEPEPAYTPALSP